MVSGLGDLEPVALRSGQAADFDEVIAHLVEIGYARTDLVEHRGEIAVRGGILDVFPPTEEHPLRVEFWGDTVEEIRYFRAADQRSLHAAADGLWAPPCRELLLTPEVRERARRLAEDDPGLAEILGKLADGITVEGMEAFAPVLADRMDLLLDHVPPGGLVLACDPERIRARADDLVRTSQEFLDASWVNAAAGGQAPIDLGAAAFQPLPEVRRGRPAPGHRLVDGDPVQQSADEQPHQRHGHRRHRRQQHGRDGPRRGGTLFVSDGSRARARLPGRDSRAPSRTFASGWPAAGGWCWSPRGTARPSGWPRCCAARTSGPASATWTSRPSRPCLTSAPG